MLLGKGILSLEVLFCLVACLLVSSPQSACVEYGKETVYSLISISFERMKIKKDLQRKIKLTSSEWWMEKECQGSGETLEVKGCSK